MSEEHYRTLGISLDASKAEIRAAYKQRVKETHPDLNDDPNAADEFQRVKAARDALLGSGATGAATSGGAGRSGPGSSRSGSASGTDGTGTSSSGGSSRRSSQSGGQTETSGGGTDSRDRRSDTDGSDPRANYSTRTEEPSGDRADQYGGAARSSGRASSGSSSTGSGAGDRTRTNRSETGAGSSGRQRETGGSAGRRTSSGSTDRRQDTGAGVGGAQDFVRFRSVIEEPTGNRAASYDRVVGSQDASARQRTSGAGTRTGTTGTSTETGGDVPSIPMLLPAFLVVLVKQYIYSLKWALLGLPLTGLYLIGIRGLYFGGFQTSALSMVLGAVGVSLVKARLGVNFAGTATIALAYYVFVWYPSQPYGPLSLLEVGIAVHLLPLFVVTALIAEYK